MFSAEIIFQIQTGIADSARANIKLYRQINIMGHLLKIGSIFQRWKDKIFKRYQYQGTLGENFECDFAIEEDVVKSKSRENKQASINYDNLIMKFIMTNNELYITELNDTTLQIGLKEMYVPFLESLEIDNYLLRYLSFGKNIILDLGVNENLKLLCCHSMISSLNISGCRNLQHLFLNFNKFTSIDLSKNTSLELLHCAYSNLVELDLSNNSLLTNLDCSSNQLTNIVLPPSIKRLYMPYNKITVLDLSNCKSLKSIVCTSNPLQKIVISKKQKRAAWLRNVKDVYPNLEIIIN